MKKNRVAAVLVDRHSFIVFNMLITYVLIASTVKMAPMLFDAGNYIHALDDICDANGTILIAYGVVLEERESIMRILGVCAGNIDCKIDGLCHDLGVELLVIGLFMEVVVQLIKIPNTIVNTDGIEWLLFIFGSVFAVTSACLIVVNCFKLTRARLA